MMTPSKKLLLLPALALLAACTETPKVNPSPAAQDQPAEPANPAFEKKISEGIDFIGLGNEPFWGLDIDFEKTMQFSTPDGGLVSAPAVMAKKAQDGALIYESQAEGNTLKVTVRKEDCSDGMSDNRYNYSITVVVNGKQYKGCGKYLAASPGSYWTLQSMNGKPAGENTFPTGRLPVLQISTKESRYAGSDGCNNILGKATVTGNSIKLEPGISTMMACPDDGHEEYGKALYAVTEFKIENRQLTLSAGGKPVLVYGL